jgi:hypothetical protein
MDMIKKAGNFGFGFLATTFTAAAAGFIARTADLSVNVVDTTTAVAGAIAGTALSIVALGAWLDDTDAKPGSVALGALAALPAALALVANLGTEPQITAASAHQKVATVEILNSAQPAPTIS